MAGVSLDVVRGILDEIYPDYHDDIPEDNIEKILAGLNAGETTEEVTDFLDTGGHKIDYSALITDFASIASLAISAVSLYLDHKKSKREGAEAKPESGVILSLMDQRVRDDPRLPAIIEAVRRADP
ncbi:hypothetical protein [Sphingobium yanoikuyae]|uniref:hypothetical protein n=1 Tax=Sphingobium yanoikuyae TaxID=13690 RepID=UPI002FDDC0F2